MRNRFSDPAEACQPYQDEPDTDELDTNERYHQQEDDHDLMVLTRDPYEDPALYEDTHVEACTNCGAYHSRPTYRCLKCEAL